MATFPGFSAYGGATITRVVDGAGAEWIGCCAKDSAGVFAFYVFKNGVNVPISPLCTGRGSINQDGHWIAWDGAAYFTGALPGFTPLPNDEARIAALEAQVAQLQQTIMHLPPTTTNPVVRIPAAGGKEGGEIQLASGNTSGPWVIDAYNGMLRFIHDNVLIDEWTVPRKPPV